ncbi:hypothetical protein AYK20_04555 [Thermoplasmatales archaeon SG8-52-1]|nr:MAG: hypothetical protein AYK20_04555 [Thermoplasmatales archaeon SG8-52-1]
MKLTRASYPIFFAIIIFSVIRPTIGTFSEQLEEQIFFPTLIIFIVFLALGLILAIIDKELFHVVTDERTKRVDRSAIYYSWWFSIFFIILFGIYASIKNFTINQYVFVISSEMIITMLIFHMYFNFKGKL